MKSIKHSALLASAMLMAGQNAFALEEFFNAPGTRALSMGGAFAAVAADTSAIFYNPAGLGFLPDNVTDFTVEFGDVVVANDFDEIIATPPPRDYFDTERKLKYLGISGKGFGFAYFTPYEFYTNAPDLDGNVFQVRTDYKELKMGFGGKLNEGFALGGTIDYLIQSTDSNCPECEESESELGFGFTVGGLGKVTLDEKSKTDLQLAGVFRSKGSVDVVLGEFEELPTRPQTLSLGAAIKRPFTLGDWAMFATVAWQKDQLEYDGVVFLGPTGGQVMDVDQERVAFGGEFQFISPNNQSLFVRLGQYETEADGDVLPNGVAPYFGTIEGSTLGLGVILGDWVVDVAREERDIADSGWNDVGDQDEELTSFSFSRVF